MTISDSERLAAKQWCGKVSLCDLEAGIPHCVGDSYDLVLMSHILEHLCSPDKALADASRLLQERQGWLVVALPNVLFWRQRVQFAIGNFRYESGGIMDDTHVRFYTFETGKALLEGSGFHVERTQATGGFPLQPLRSVLPGGASRWVDRKAASYLPGLFGFQMIFAARGQ